MPTTIQVNDILKADFVLDLGSQIAVNSLHYRVFSIAPPAPTDFDVAASLSSKAAPLYKAYLPALATYRGVRVQKINPPQAPYVVSVLGAGVGSINEDPLPTQSSLLLSIATALAGRSYRGRTYLPFWPEGSNDALGEVDAAALVKARAWADAMFADLIVGAPPNASVLHFGIWSRTRGVFTEAATWTIRDKWATQRRRSQINRGDAMPL